MRHGHLSRHNRKRELFGLCGRHLLFGRVHILFKLRGGHVRASLGHIDLFQLHRGNLRVDIGRQYLLQLCRRHLSVECRSISLRELFDWPVFSNFGELVHELQCGNLPTKFWPGILRELRSWKPVRLCWHVNEHGVSCRQLLRHRGTFSRVRCVCRGLLFGGLRLGLFGLRRGDVHLKHGAGCMHELLTRLLSRPKWPKHMHRVHGWELLRHDGALGSHGDLRRRTILTGLCLGLYELLGRTVSSECRLNKLHELPYGYLP